MARWFEIPLILALVTGVVAQVSPPGEIYATKDQRRAVLLEFAELYAEPSTDGPIVTALPAGTVLEYVGETEDAFGRAWFTVRDPDRLVRRSDTYLVPFDARQFAAHGHRGALLADRRASVSVAAAEGRRGDDESPWWEPVGVLELGHNARYDDVVGVSARAPREDEVRELIALLGGPDAIAVWPEDPLPGQLFVPEMVPVLFRFDGSDWLIAQPVRLLGETLSVLGNGLFRPDEGAPPLAGGPKLHCWELVGALDPSNELAGSIAIAPPPAAPGRGAAAVPDFGPYDLAAAPQAILDVVPPAPPETRVPQRVDPPSRQGGVLLDDNDGRQAVYIEQRLGPELIHRLRGRAMVVDVVARNAPRSQAAATFGVDVEVGFADGREVPPVATSFTASETPRRFEHPFEVPEDAETLTVRLLPLDRTLAVEQRGSVILDRISLRPASWDPEPPASSVLLYRITASSFEGDLLHTRTPIAVTTRPVDEVQRVWPQVVISGWSAEDKGRVLAGEVRQGMTPEHVRAAWGEPQSRVGPEGEDRWDYGDRYVLFAGGKVVVFRPRQIVEEEVAPKICTSPPPPQTSEQWP